MQVAEAFIDLKMQMRFIRVQYFPALCRVYGRLNARTSHIASSMTINPAERWAKAFYRAIDQIVRGARLNDLELYIPSGFKDFLEQVLTIHLM